MAKSEIKKPPYKKNYLNEVSKELKLNDKLAKQNNVENIINNNSIKLDPIQRQDRLIVISKKLEKEAKHQELIFNIKKDKKQNYDMKELENRERIDELYY